MATENVGIWVAGKVLSSLLDFCVFAAIGEDWPIFFKKKNRYSYPGVQ